MGLYSFIGVAVTSATVVIYGSAIWDPVELLSRFESPFWHALGLFGLVLATLATNLAANVVGPANDFANLSPRHISFRTGAILTGLIGILIQPWRLVEDPSGYIFKWLVAYSALLGAVGGVMIADYYVLRPDKNNFLIATKSDGTGVVTAPTVVTGGGFATIKEVTTGDLSYDASPQDIQNAFIAQGFGTSNGSALQASGSIIDGFFITYGGSSSNINFDPLTIVNNTLAAGAGVSANLAFTTTAFVSIVSAGSTSGIIELEVTSGAQKQTMTMDCNFADDIIDP
jgi:hypothetical protein